MLEQLEKTDVPEWLAQISPATSHHRLPLQELLADSLYYPACGFDGTPIRYCNGNLVSFVYADYQVTKNRLMEEFKDRPFRGYTLLYQRDVSADELVPPGWIPPVVPTERIDHLIYMQRPARPFAHWSVWQRDTDRGDNHGAERFSLLYLAGEMSATYQGLYYHHRVLPKLLALICPGSFGCEWEAAAHQDSFFHKVVAGHPDGLPRYFLTDYYAADHACFPEYRHLVRTLERVRLYSLQGGSLPDHEGGKQ